MAVRNLLNAIGGLFAGRTSTEWRPLVSENLQVVTLAAGTASTATTSASDVCVKGDHDITSASFASVTAIASDASNYATITLERYRAGSAVTVAELSTSLASVVAHIPTSLVVTESYRTILDGDVLTTKVTKAASGVATGLGVITLDAQKVF